MRAPWGVCNTEAGAGAPLPAHAGFGSRGAVKPVREVRLAELCPVEGNEGALPGHRAVEARARVGDHLARIVARAQPLADEVVEAELFGPRDLERSVQGRSQGDADDHARD